MSDQDPEYLIATGSLPTPAFAQYVERLEETLREIAEIQPKVLGYIRREGFVFEDIGTERGNWQHLAFSIYSDLCRADLLARQALEDAQH